MNYDFDLFVIGAGSGGVRAARLASQCGQKVALAEEFRYGGTCVIRGCVPKKLMVYASEFSEIFNDATGYGWSVGKHSFDWKKFIQAKDKEINRLESIYSNILTNNNVTHYNSRAHLKNNNTIVLSSGEVITAKYILIATGGRPFVPNIIGNEHVITSNEIFDLSEKPNSILIVGGGYIACEFACILNGLGVSTTQFYRGNQILRGFDAEVQNLVSNEMQNKGINLSLNNDVESINKIENGYLVKDKSNKEIIIDQILYATGRVPNCSNIGLEDLGIETGSVGEIIVDEYSRTNIDNIYAIGDVTNRVQLTPVAIVEAAAFVETVFKSNPIMPDHELIATAVFTQPEIGTVGLTEEEALKQCPIEVYSAKFRPMKVILAGRDEQMLMKLIVEKNNRKVLGCHIVGHGAAEMIQLAGVAIKMGATKEDFDKTMAIHPTAAEELVTMSTPTR
ncbi:glutathione-disulfide reductase [Amylibacter sp.]|nr:glutathione-disulfide reductase [Amylibacter sp.]MDC0982560.1 glutathione-disulfide reductase [Amylibacter sp.]